MPRILIALTACVALTAGCTKPPVDPLQLEGTRLIVDNRTSDDWTDVEIWLNRVYRITVPRIAAGSRFTAPLDVFVAGFGQRFDFKRQQITDLRLAAKTADGTPVELVKQFEKSGLAGALGGKK
jgi:hypothetical protein